jgi:KDO2-lipid IV(A) lauroyltransferase
VSLRERAIGRLVVLQPNGKYRATERLAVELGLAADGRERAFLRANAGFVWTYYGRFARLAASGGRQRAISRVDVVGAANLEAARSAGRGAILLSVHLGDFDVAGAWLAGCCGLTPVVVAAPLRPAWRERMFTAIRRRCGVVVRDIEATRLDDLVADLGRGRFVLAMLDRRPHRRAAASTARMLGRTSAAPAGMAMLAASTGSPLLPAATWRGRDGRLVAWFGEPLATTDNATALAHVAACAGQLGEHIRAHPEQWHIPADLREMAWGSAGAEAGASDLPDGLAGDIPGAAHVRM